MLHCRTETFHTRRGAEERSQDTSAKTKGAGGGYQKETGATWKTSGQLCALKSCVVRFMSVQNLEPKMYLLQWDIPASEWKVIG